MSFLSRLMSTTSWVYELAKWAIMLAVFLTLVHLYLGSLTRVTGASMAPTLSEGQYVLVRRLYLGSELSRGAIVTLRFPGDPERVRYVKRVIGLPGETVTIQEGQVYVNGNRLAEPYLSAALTPKNVSQSLGKDEYFLLGDNREASSDSRSFGPVERRFISGVGLAIVWPVSALNPLLLPTY